MSGSRYELAGLGFRDGMRGSRRSAAPPLSGKSRHDQELWRIPQDLPGGAGKRGEPDPVIEEDAGWTVSEILFWTALMELSGGLNLVLKFAANCPIHICRSALVLSCHPSKPLFEKKAFFSPHKCGKMAFSHKLVQPSTELRKRLTPPISMI